LKEFESKRPIITPQFHNLKLSLQQTDPSFTVLNNSIEKKPFKLAIRYPNELSDSINFKYILNSITNGGGNSSAGAVSQMNSNGVINKQLLEQNANMYAISELLADRNEIIFKIWALPEVGTFNFTVYAGVIDDYNVISAENQNQLNKNDEDMKAVLSMKISSSKVTHFEIPPNHITEITVFGMNNIMKKLGLVCHDYLKGILGTDREGKVNLVFEMSHPLDVEAYLYSSDSSISSRALELCVLKRVAHNFLIFIIYPPHPGLYGLDLHGTIKGSHQPLSSIHSQLPPIGKYLIKSHHQIRMVTQFPKGDNRNWGPKQRFYDMGLHTVTYSDPYIINEDGKQIEIEIAMLKSVTMWYKFDHDLNGTPKAIDNFCFMNYKHTNNRRERTISFMLRFPSRGFYHLALMATDVFPAKPDEIVYNYLIRVQDPANDVDSFPIIENPILWRDCCLIAPKMFRLNNHDVHFSVIVPNSKRVRVVAGDHVEELESRELQNSWVGLVTLNPTSLNSRHVYIEAELNNNNFKRLIRFKARSYDQKNENK
jgi:hypothetical protein